MTPNPLDGHALGGRWKRRPPGKEIVSLERVWLHPQGWTVRVHPVRGGKPLVCSVGYLLENYDPLGAS